MAYQRKSWREKLADNKGLPKVAAASGRMAARWGKGTMVIPAPCEVDELMRRVPKGKVTTYGDLAKELSKREPHWSPLASRAVGTTMRNNPCGPQIPCHRVVKSNGAVGNFRGGAEGAVGEKIAMLRDEGIIVKDGRIDLKKFRHIFK